MKISYLFVCLILHLCQHAHGIFFSGTWFQNLLNQIATTTTTATPTTTASSSSAAASPQNSYNISPDAVVLNTVTGSAMAVSNLVLAIGDNISGPTSRRKRSVFDPVSNTFKTGASDSPKQRTANFNFTSQEKPENRTTTNHKSSNSDGQDADAQDTPRHSNNGSAGDRQKPNPPKTEDNENRASNFLSGLQDRFANSPINGFNPSNISQGFGKNFKNPFNSVVERLNKTNFLQNFNDGVQNFVDQLANANPGIQIFISNNNLSTFNPIQTFAQLGLNGLIPHPVETLTNLSMDQLENQVHDYLNNGLGDVQNEAHRAQSLGSKLANLIPNLAANAIKDIQNMIQLSGVVACVSKHPLPFSNVIQIAANASSKCVAEKVDQAASIFNHTAANLQNATVDLQKLRDSISECSQRVTTTTSGLSLTNVMTLNSCYAAALFDIQSETVLLPLSIAQRVAEGIVLATSLRGQMIKCAANLAKDVATQAYTASQAIAKCIDSKG